MARLGELDEALELMHFGFRAIVAEPDRELARRGFGRVHHRVLYFLRRNEAISVGELVRILGVTKQALHRPLSELAAAKYVLRDVDPTNRRVVRLRLSKAGAAFEQALSGAQRDHFARAFARVGPVAERGWREVMQTLARTT
jgi:DNA-binding MarR family transcriptional regulator